MSCNELAKSAEGSLRAAVTVVGADSTVSADSLSLSRVVDFVATGTNTVVSSCATSATAKVTKTAGVLFLPYVGLVRGNYLSVSTEKMTCDCSPGPTGETPCANSLRFFLSNGGLLVPMVSVPVM